MDRRDFLTGLVISTAGAVAGVQLATPEQAAALGVGTSVTMQPTVPPPASTMLAQQLYWQDRHGQFQPFGVLTEMHWDREHIPIATTLSVTKDHIKGFTRVNFRGTCIGPVDWPL